MGVASAAVQALGTLFKIGDGGVGAGTQASKTIGTGNQQLKVLAKTAGVAGNSKTFGITVSGTNTAYSQTITATSVSITSATDGGGLATTTVADAISSLYLDATFDANFEATVGTGNGTGVLVAGASGALSGGVDGAEVFTTLGGVTSIAGPGFKADVLDVTHMESPNNFHEKITTLVDGGQLTTIVQFVPNSTQHRSVLTDLKNRTKRNVQIWFADTGGSILQVAGYFIQFAIDSQFQGIYTANLQMELTADYTWIV